MRAPLKTTLASLLTLLVAGCGLTVTNERPTYDELSQPEQGAVDVILKELTAVDRNIKVLSRQPNVDIKEIVDRERIHVSFDGLIFVTNIGDNTVHVATWENLTETQQKLVQKWWNAPSLAITKAWYNTFFYRFMAAAQGIKQYMFKVLTPQWVFAHRTVFNIERDSIRVALAHYVAQGQQSQIWPFVTNLCKPVLQQYRKRYPGTFPDIPAAKRYMNANITQMANPDDPTGYMYFICEWIELGKTDTGSMQVELDWLRDLPLP